MTRKILAGILVGLSSLLLLLSVIGIGLAWFYNEPLTRDGLARLEEIDTELSLAENALKDTRLEIQRTLRIIDAAEETLSQLKDELSLARSMFGEVDQTIEGQLVPGLQGTRRQINSAINAVEEIRVFLKQLSENFIVSQALSFLNLTLPGDQLLVEIIAIGTSLDSQITGMQALTEKASIFLKDASYMMGGDLGETRQNLQNFLKVIDEYDQKLAAWRVQVAHLTQSLPRWLDITSSALTIFLLWFAFSQFGMILHGLALWRGENPAAVLRRPVEDDISI
jgi:hypothetical protein